MGIVRTLRSARAWVALWLALAVVAVPVKGSSQGIDGELAQERPVAEAVAADRERDAVIAERIRIIFRGVDGLERVLVRVEAGIVTLSGRVPDAADAATAVELAGRVEGVLLVNDATREITDLSERMADFNERTQQRLWQAVAMLPLLGVALVALGGMVLLGRFLSNRRWPFERLAPNGFIAALMRHVVLIVFSIAGLVLALDILNATWLLSTVLGAAGIVGLAVGFAVRDTVENYVASILLSLRQPFRPRDFVQIAEHMGTVAKLTSRATIMMTPDGNHLRIPNATVYKAVITNFTLNPNRRFTFQLGIDTESDSAHALDLGRRTLEALPFTLDDPEPIAWVDRVGDSNIVINYAAWIDQRETSFLRARGEAMRLVKLALEDDGFTLPEPIYRLRIDGQTAGGPQVTVAETEEEPRHSSDEEDRFAGDVGADHTIERRVLAEAGDELAEEDLLDERAPREM